MKKTNLIFDIGKTNKKCFLFDRNYKVVYKTYRQFKTIKDEDGHPTDDLPAICKWIKKTLKTLIQSPDFEITTINFSTYGASLIHLDEKGKVLTPLYNYTKTIPASVMNAFYKIHGKATRIAKETAAPPAGMLNAGFQLYWLKNTQPALFKQIRYSLHFPQYLSYLFTGIPLSEYSSIGCHTSLWDYKKEDYHDWVYAEGINRILAPIVPTTTSINTIYKGKKIKIGIGIHDSSAALLPYLLAEDKPFVLVSTGTWSISLNPFAKELLTKADLQNGCLNYMRINGQPVKAARLFLGQEYKEQLERLSLFFKKEKSIDQTIHFDKKIVRTLNKGFKYQFRFHHLRKDRTQPAKTNYNGFKSFEEAYHQLMLELVELQIEAIQKAIGSSKIKKIYIDGGFSDNDIFVKLLATHFSNKKIRTTKSPIGSALGAAMVLNEEKIGKRFLKNNFAMKKHSSQNIKT